MLNHHHDLNMYLLNLNDNLNIFQLNQLQQLYLWNYFMYILVQINKMLNLNVNVINIYYNLLVYHLNLL